MSKDSQNGHTYICITNELRIFVFEMIMSMAVPLKTTHVIKLRKDPFTS